MVSPRAARGLPPRLAQRDNAVVRPRDAADVYVNPHAEFARLVDNGLLLRVAPGSYAIVPRPWVGRVWRPDLAAVALGIAQADYGRDAVALTNVSAARHHGAIPRALATATVAVPTQRPPLRVGDGTVHFTQRTVARIDVEAVETEITAGWVTTVEQTLLDLAARPTFGGVEPGQADEAIRVLAARADWDRVTALARPQHKLKAMAYAQRVAEAS
ncbi:MAG TPA: type IV toxin-antitoxin system AbiEi family antitoxin [Frankiaceae bacterium]|nr:type IV toxin-antitoxin system AbiEi family antitoxin [Frankiaceae bacterium]